jgi:branched-chain amino acid aminotransferase
MVNLVWVNEALVPSEFARVSVFDHGFTVGDGVFETMQVKAGAAFALNRHLKRLENSAKLLGINFLDLDYLKTVVNEVIKVNPELSSAGRLRVTLTSGDGPLGSDRNSDKPTLVVAMSGLPKWAESAKIASVKMPRNHLSPLAGAKTTSYAENVLALATAKQQGADEAILPNVLMNICEGTGSNFFAVIDDKVFTPPLSAGCLGGITRELVCEWFDCIEEDLPYSSLSEIPAGFLTSTTRDVQPISQIDSRVLAKDHEVITKIQSEFLVRMKQTVDP